MSITQELLDLKFTNWTDDISRHTVFVKNAVLSENIIANYKSAQFNNLSYLQLIDNQSDWLLGSTVNNNLMVTENWGPTNSDNEFTLDCWIYPVRSQNQYYPIISSFKDVWFTNTNLNLGWSFQLDTFSGKLQLISYLFGNSDCRVIQSYGSVQLNQWNHVALMSWKMDGYSLKYFFINGVADGGYLDNNTGYKTLASKTTHFSISNILTREAYNGQVGQPDYSPVYIGMGPITSFTHPNIGSSLYFKKESGLSFTGFIGRFRIGLGTRYPISGNAFDPFFNVSTSNITTTSTTTNSSTLTTTTLGERGEIPINITKHDLLALKLRNNIIDLTNRHYILPIGQLNFSLTDLGCNSLSFNGTNYLLCQLNTQDFSLGSTLLVNNYEITRPVCKNDNQFSLEFWIKPQKTDNKYMGICGSFSKNFFPTDIGDINNFSIIINRRDFGLGWALLLDVESEKLLIVSFKFGSIKHIITSKLSVPFNQWSHIAFMSAKIGTAEGLKFLFINGNPDIITSFNNSITSLTNGVHRGSVATVMDNYAPLFIGLGPNISNEDTDTVLDYNYASYFVGNMSSFRLASNSLYPTDGTGFIPSHIPDSISITSGTTETTSTTSTESSTTTNQFPNYIKVIGIISSNQQTDGSNSWSQITCQ